MSGVQFPLLIGLLGRGDRDVGKHVGLACGWNTLGAILGSLAGGFGILPLLTAPGAWRPVVIILVITGVALWIYVQRHAASRPAMIATWSTAIVAAASIVCTGPTAVWRHGSVGAGRPAGTNRFTDANDLHNWENEVRRSVLWEADGIESSVAIVGADGLAFHVNGMCDGNAVEDVGTQVMLGLIGGGASSSPAIRNGRRSGNGRDGRLAGRRSFDRTRRCRRVGTGGPGSGPPLPRGQSQRPVESQGANGFQQRAGSAAYRRGSL